jgi:cytochrome b involved in lipid metabolism
MTLAEVAMHAAEDDCYLVVRDRVYDATGFVAQHPGGRIILTYAGEDATGTHLLTHTRIHTHIETKAARPICTGERNRRSR